MSHRKYPENAAGSPIHLPLALGGCGKLVVGVMGTWGGWCLVWVPRVWGVNGVGPTNAAGRAQSYFFLKAAFEHGCSTISRGRAGQREVSCITLQLTRAWRLFFRPWTPSMKVGTSETDGDAFIGWFGATISTMRCAAKRMRIPALGNFSVNGCPATAHCAFARAWLTRDIFLSPWTEVTVRSPDTSTDKEVVRVEIATGCEHPDID